MSNFTFSELHTYVLRQPAFSAKLHEITGQLLDGDSTIKEAEDLLNLLIEVTPMSLLQEDRIRNWMAKECAEILHHEFCTWKENFEYKLETRTVKIKKLAEQAPIF